jgi:hypothetical protein
MDFPGPESESLNAQMLVDSIPALIHNAPRLRDDKKN